MRTSSAFFVLSCLLLHSVAQACDDWAARVVSVNGSVLVKDSTLQSAAPALLQPDAVICPGQQVEVGSNSRAAIYLSNNSFVRLDENTVMSFPAVQAEGSFWVELKQGVSHFISRITMRFGVKTAYTNAVVDGTEFLVSANPDSTQVSVVEGTVTVTIGQRGINIPVHAGEGVIVDSSPEYKRIELSATDSVDWAIYFPPLVIVDELKSTLHQSALSAASDHLKRSRPDLAIKELETLSNPDSASQVALAASYLAVGNIDGAETAINNINTPQAQALRALIAVVINQPQRALGLARQHDAQTLSSRLALSYAYQANLDLPSALDVAREAAQRYPEAYMAWVRLSELQVASGDVGAARDSIAKARAIAPGDAAVLVQSAYVDMFNNRFKQAEDQFQQALALYSENPQARLGLGLVLLRQGDLEAGRKQIEYAVSLDPARSVLRSYLGRAYFEEKRDAEAAVQWDLAKQLDPEDPTAYFYEGVRKLYSNDPIGAIEDLEASRRLNNERSLYRSEILLQSDDASRSAVLARAYDGVGYQQGVLLAGREALKDDPTNTEGHRLLADKYRGNSRFEEARASELLQSQLWQPLSAYPLQPQLGETGIGFVEGSGPQVPGYNEYHSLFTQNGVYGVVNGYGGSDGTWADDAVGSFLAGPLAVSLGQYHFESDGWRRGTEQEQDIYNAFFQWQFSAQTDIQFESRKFKWLHGGLTPNIDDQELGLIDYKEERETNRFGLKHRINANNALLVSYIKQEQDFWSNTNDELSIRAGAISDDVDTLEFQHVLHKPKYKLVSGVGISSFEGDSFGQVGLEFLGGGLLPGQWDIEILNDTYEEIDQNSAYVYYSFIAGNQVDITLGLDFDRFKFMQLNNVTNTEPAFLPFPPPGQFIPFTEDRFNESDDVREQYSPKFGLEYEWVTGSRLRFALFRTASDSSTNNQTIKPTQVAGFNQLYSDANFSDAKNIAFGFDRVLSENMDMVFAITRRVVDYPVLNSANNGYLRYEYKEALAEIEFLKKLNDLASVSFGGEWLERRLSDDGDIALNEACYGEAYRIPIQFTLLGEDTWSFVVEQNYYHHKFEYETSQNNEFVEASWITNVVVSKSLYGRRGSFQVGVENLFEAEKEVSNYDQSQLMYYPNRFLFCKLNISL